MKCIGMDTSLPPFSPRPYFFIKTLPGKERFVADFLERKYRTIGLEAEIEGKLDTDKIEHIKGRCVIGGE